MKKIIITGVLLVPFLGMTSSIYADYSSKMGNRPEMSEEQQEEMEEIQAILEKQKNGETLTDEEQELLDEWEANKPEMTGSGETMERSQKSSTKENSKTTSNLSEKYRTVIDAKIESIIESLEDYDTDDKIAALETLEAKIEAIKENVEDSSYSDTKKELYISIIDYMIEKIEYYIEQFTNEEEVIDEIDEDDILDSLLN